MVQLFWCVVLFLSIFVVEELSMGLIRDAATEAVRDLVRGTVLYGGLSAISGAYHVTSGAVHAVGSIPGKVKAAKEQKEIKKAEKEFKKSEKEALKAEKKEARDAKKEEIINLIKNPSEAFKKYSHALIAICSDKTDSRTYVLITPENQIKFMTNGSIDETGVCLYDYDENLIGKVAIEESENGDSGIKKFSKTLKLCIGDNSIGTVEITVTDSTKTIRLKSYFWNVWIKAGDSSAEEEDMFKMSPLGILGKKAYQIAYNDPGKEVILALTYIGLSEAKQILKDNKL